MGGAKRRPNVKNKNIFSFDVVPNVPKKYIYTIMSIVDLDDRYSSEAPKSQGPVWVMSMRWSVLHDDVTKEKLVAMCEKYAKHWIFQAEDTKDNPHYQGYINLKEKDRPSSLGKKLNKEFCGIQFLAASNDGKEKLKQYCLKDETRVAGPWSDQPIYMGEDLEELRGWQLQLFEMLKGKPDKRTVIWICQPEGNIGKTDFVKYMAFKHNACFLSYGKAADLLNIVSKCQNRKYYLFNLPKTKPVDFANGDIYNVFESIKDGMFINTKYETKQVLMSRPHVVVFANYMPDVKKISFDRWKIFNIKNDSLEKIDA